MSHVNIIGLIIDALYSSITEEGTLGMGIFSPIMPYNQPKGFMGHVIP
jgi:hypothetical protein